MNKLKLIIIGIVTGIIILIFLIISILTSQTKTPPPQPVISPTVVQFNTDELFITNILPINTDASFLPGQPIQITFTQEVDRKGLKFEITPTVEVLINYADLPNTLVISPKTVWVLGETNITILPQTVSTTGNVLKNAQTYRIKTAIPTLPEGSYEAY